MRIYWLCNLEEFPRPNFWQPHINTLQQTIGFFPNAWSTTDALRVFKYAIGTAEVTSAQLSAIQADNAIMLIDQSLLFSTFGSLPGAARNNINRFLDDAGIARPDNNEVLHDLWTRVTQIIDNKSLDDLINTLDSMTATPP